jgi:6-phospho-3-hexuloisomerase
MTTEPTRHPTVEPTADPAATILGEISRVLDKVERREITALASGLAGVTRVLVAGEGRSGLMGKAFAMRLMHLGLTVYVLGETTTPAVAGGDTVVAISGSGTTAGTVRAATAAVGVGAEVWAVTSDPASELAGLASGRLVLPAATKYRRPDEPPTIQPLSSLFDQVTHIVLDTVCLEIASAKAVDNAAARAAHSNTE